MPGVTWPGQPVLRPPRSLHYNAGSWWLSPSSPESRPLGKDLSSFWGRWFQEAQGWSEENKGGEESLLRDIDGQVPAAGNGGSAVWGSLRGCRTHRKLSASPFAPAPRGSKPA